MIPALNMHLEDVRVVLKNEINDITVCRDLKGGDHTFYTMVSLKDDRYRKFVTEQMNQKGIFSHCSSFVGSFSLGKELKLLFCYENDSLIENVGSIYLYDFARCRTAAMNLVGVMAESGITGQISKLLLNPRNINVNSDCEITLNYFLDFAEFDLQLQEFDEVGKIAETVFSILERPWRERFHGDENLYPDELRLFFMKIQNHSFLSCGQIMSQLRSMPNKPIARQGLLWRARKLLYTVKSVLFQNPMRIFLTLLVAVTILYAAYQIGIRIRVKRAYDRNVSYSAMEYIGSVYLGNEE